jgi:hypothetical protein
MTKRAVHRVSPLASVVALCLLLLQLVNALHFALIPHGFGAGPSGLVHVHRTLTAANPERTLALSATQQPQERPKLVARFTSSDSEACPVGFSGPASRLVPPHQLCSLISLPAVREQRSQARAVVDRSRALLAAPKTSPPFAC